jgi:hypothetical protein
MPRKSAASLAIATPVTVQRRLQPPTDLSDFQRAVWTATVNARPASWFGDEHLPILLQYVRHLEAANKLAKQIDAIDMAWIMADEEGVKRYDRLLRLQVSESNVIAKLAGAMRMTQQSVHQAHKRVPDKEAESKQAPWRKQA